MSSSRTSYRKLTEAKTAFERQRNEIEAGEPADPSWRNKVDKGKPEMHADRAEASACWSDIIAQAALADAALAA